MRYSAEITSNSGVITWVNRHFDSLTDAASVCIEITHKPRDLVFIKRMTIEEMETKTK